MSFVFAGDSWAMKAFNETNWTLNSEYQESDFRLSDTWQLPYISCYAPGRGNLECMRRIKELNTEKPIIWVWTEVGRDYGEIYDRPPHEWLQRDDFFRVRGDLTARVLQRIRQELPNPIALIGGLGDIDPVMAYAHDIWVLHHSWQAWMAQALGSRWFQFGWGAGDVGWRQDYDHITPSRAMTFAWDQQIKEWCWWEQQGYMCHEHPTELSCREFGSMLKSQVWEWLDRHEQG